MMRACRLSFPLGITMDGALPRRGEGTDSTPGDLEVPAMTAGLWGVSLERGKSVPIIRGIGASSRDNVLLKMRTLDPASFFFP